MVHSQPFQSLKRKPVTYLRANQRDFITDGQIYLESDLFNKGFDLQSTWDSP